MSTYRTYRTYRTDVEHVAGSINHAGAGNPLGMKYTGIKTH